jgi:hypothetical protein
VGQEQELLDAALVVKKELITEITRHVVMAIVVSVVVN